MTCIRLVALFLVFACAATSGPITANWLTTSSGTLAGVSFTTTGLGGPFLGLRPRAYLDPFSFSAAPVALAVAVEYSATDDWSVTFGSPLSSLLVYVDVWRGDYNVGVNDGISTYAFNRPFTILSGLAEASVTGNTLRLPDNGDFTFYNGILFFAGPVTTLSVDATALNSSAQIMTFGTNEVPEPGSVTLVVAGLLCGALVLLRRRC